ncbi:hypothetical protein Tco_0865574 [Tanacetum coccineum]
MLSRNSIGSGGKHITSPQSRAAKFCKGSQGTPTQSAAPFSTYCCFQYKVLCTFHGTATPHDSDAVLRKPVIQHQLWVVESKTLRSKRDKESEAKRRKKSQSNLGTANKGMKGTLSEEHTNVQE